MTALASRLLACPFCGSDAEMDTDQSFRAFVSGRFESSVAIYCTKCCVQMQHCYSDHRGTEREDLAADLIERWNTREAAAALSVPEGDIATLESLCLLAFSEEDGYGYEGRAKFGTFRDGFFACVRKLKLSAPAAPSAKGVAP